MDIVAIYTADGQQVLRSARPIKAMIKPEAKIMEHPLEDETTIVDDKVLLPINIELQMILLPNEVQSTYSQIKKLFTDSDILTVYTRADAYPNQIIAALPHEEDPSYFDTITISLRLKQVKFSATEITTIAPRNRTQQDTVNRGNLQPQPVRQESTALRLARGIFG